MMSKIQNRTYDNKQYRIINKSDSNSQKQVKVTNTPRFKDLQKHDYQ